MRNSTHIPDVEKKNVVFLVDTAPQTTELLRVAQALSENGLWQVTFVFIDEYVGRKEHIQICKQRNYIVDLEATNGSVTKNVFRRMFLSAKNIFKR